jgi:NCS1 family nucleobase:cation symporter-1
VLRRQKLHLRELFDPDGRYRYSNGFNWRAILALVLAIAPCVPGFLHAATGGKIRCGEFLQTVYTYSWFTTFAVGFILYAILMVGHSNLRQES